MFAMHDPAHPGEVLREYLPEEMSVTEAAERLGVSRQALSAILNGRTGISAEMDLRLAQALGTTPGPGAEGPVGREEEGRSADTAARCGLSLARSGAAA